MEKEQNLSVQTEHGCIQAFVSPDSYNPGIILMMIGKDGKEKAACIMEHRETDDAIHMRVYSPDDPDGEPLHDIVISQ